MNKNILIELVFVIGKIWIKKKPKNPNSQKAEDWLNTLLLLYNMKYFKLVHRVASSLSIFF